MIDQLLLVLQYTGIFALCLPSLFFVAGVIGLIKLDSLERKKHNLRLMFFWGAICVIEYLLAQYIGGIL